VQRRLAELEEQGTGVDRAVLHAQVVERDRQDAGRAIAPLRAASDAIEIDSSELSVEQVVDRIASLVPSRR
jgi:CMP/dCMP kinase